MSVPLEVFCCYAREDQEMLEHLKKHLMPLQRSGQITVWSDTSLNAGVEWEKELHQHLESADIILLLISSDFIASDYCYSTEMGRAIVRHNEGNVVVIPILLRSTVWQNAPFARLQMVPTNTKPITNWPDRDDAFHDVTMQISQVVSELHAKRAQVEADEPALTRMQQTSGQKTSPTAQNPLVSSVQVPPIPSLLSMGSQQSFATLLHILTTKPQAIELLHTFEGHKKTVLSVALTGDGLVLASGSNDTTIKLWNTQTGQLHRHLSQTMKRLRPQKKRLEAFLL
jgi:WD40 repeat protein